MKVFKILAVVYIVFVLAALAKEKKSLFFINHNYISIEKKKRNVKNNENDADEIRKKDLLLDLYTDGGETNWNYINRGRDWTWKCKGNEQSPIDIEAIKGSCDNSMIFDFTLSEDIVLTSMQLKDNMLVAEGEFSKLYATDVDGELAGYNAISMEIHSPSEHKIEGHIYDAELHIIHEMRSEFY
jgi:carbonic anhydrase